MARTKQTARKNSQSTQGNPATFQNPNMSLPPLGDPDDPDDPMNGANPPDDPAANPPDDPNAVPTRNKRPEHGGKTPRAHPTPSPARSTGSGSSTPDRHKGKAARKNLPSNPPKKAPNKGRRRHVGKKTGWSKIAAWNREAIRTSKRKGTKRGIYKPPAAQLDAQGRVKRRKPGARALSEIRFYQRTHSLLIAKRAFLRLVKEITQDFKTDIRWQAVAVYNLQVAVESFLEQYFDMTNLCAIHAKRVTIFPKDMILVKNMADYNFYIISRANNPR